MLQQQRLFELQQLASSSRPENSVTSTSVDHVGFDGRSFVLILDGGCRMFVGTVEIDDESNANPSTEFRSVPWFEDFRARCVTFSPEGDFLLVGCRDGSLFVVDVRKILPKHVPRGREYHYRKWSPKGLDSLDGGIHKISGKLWPCISRSSYQSDSKWIPNSILWWNTQDFTSLALIGTNLGAIVAVDLVNGEEVGSIQVSQNALASMEMVSDRAMDCSYVIITDESGKHWRLLLEQRTTGYSWPTSSPTEAVDKVEYPTPRSRLAAGLKLISVASLTSLRQRLSEGKKIFDRMGGNHYHDQIVNHDQDENVRPECLTCKIGGDTSMSVQRSCSDSSFLAGIHSYSGILSTHVVDPEINPQSAYKIPPNTKRVLFLDKVILTSGQSVDSQEHQVLNVVSAHYSEIHQWNDDEEDESNKTHEESNPGIIQSFRLSKGEKVLGFHSLPFLKSSNATSSNNSNCSNSSDSNNFDRDSSQDFAMSVKAKVQSLVNPRRWSFRETLVVTSRAVYRLILFRDPVSSFLECAMRCGGVEKDKSADNIAAAFDLDKRGLLELAGDVRVSEDDCNGAATLYRAAGCKPLKTALKFASSGHVRELLSYLELLFKTGLQECNGISDKAYLSNFALIAYFQQMLTQNTPTTKFEFRGRIERFLDENRHLDETRAIRLAIDTKEWDLLSYISKTRGLHREVVEVVIKAIRDLIGDNGDEEIDPDKLKDVSKCLQEMVSGERNCLLSCLLDPLNLQSSGPQILGFNLIKILTGSLPLLEEEGLQAVVIMSNPTRPDLRHLHSSSSSKDYCAALLNLFVTSLLLLIKKQTASNSSHINFEPKLTEIFRNEDWDPKTRKRKNVLCRVKVLAAGGGHVLLSRKTSLFGWGSTLNGVLGNGPSLPEHFESGKEISFFRENDAIRIISISAGENHSLALTNFGLYSWGSSLYGQLGHGVRHDEKRPRLIRALVGVDIVDIAAGQFHSVCLDSDGCVWTWGFGVHGQLGLGDIEDELWPRKVHKVEDIVQVSAGYAHTLCLTSRGSILSFGNNLFGQLGNSRVVKKSSLPIETDLSVLSSSTDERIDLITSGYFHNLALTSQGRLLIWGCNPQVLRLDAQQRKRTRVDNNERYEEEEETSHMTPSFVDLTGIPERIADISAGNQHSSILTENGKIYCFGRNAHGQLGNNSRKESKVPVPVSGLDDDTAIQIACGGDYTVAMIGSGTVFGWGNNGRGQLGKFPIIEEGKDTNDKILVMKTTRRIIRFNPQQSLHNSWDIPKPIPRVRQDVIYAENEFYFSRNVSIAFPELFPSQIIHDHDVTNDARYVLHSTLELFYQSMDRKTLLKKCLISENPQAAAKLSLLDGNHLQAFEFTLQAVIKHCKSFHSEAVFKSFAYYLLSLFNSDRNSGNEARHLFERLVACWQDQKWSFLHLEKMILENSSQTMLQVVVLTIFCPQEERETDRGPVIPRTGGPKLADLFTPEFCLKIGDAFVNELKHDEDRAWFPHMQEDPSKLKDLISDLLSDKN